MNLPTIVEQSGQKVLTTAQLAEAYETSDKIIRRNFERNKDHYQEGKHFYALTGKELQKFVGDNLTLAKSAKARKLYIWTERGALLHAKSLNTDKAWEVYDYLIEHYFRKKEPKQEIGELSPLLQYLIQMEQKQNHLEQRLEDIESRVEARLNYDRKELIKSVLALERIGNIQREQISRAVKKRAIEICTYLETYDKVGNRIISKIYADLQKEFNIPSYMDLRQNHYVDAMLFIESWKPEPKLEIEVQKAHPKPNFSILNAFMGWNDEGEKQS